MKPGKTPTTSFLFDIKLAIRLSPLRRVQEAMARIRAASLRDRHLVDLGDLKLSAVERKFAHHFAHVPADADLRLYIDAWLRHQQRFGQPRLRDYVPDLGIMLGQPEVLQMLGEWAYPTVARTGPKPAYAGSKAVLLSMAGSGKSSHVNDGLDDVASSPARKDTLAWALDLGARAVNRDEPEFRIVESAEGLYRHIPKLADALGRGAMKANVRMLRSLAALYPNLPICQVAAIDGTKVPAWVEQRKRRSLDDEARLRRHAPHAGYRSYNRRGSRKEDITEGEVCDIRRGGAEWRGYYLVALVDLCTGRPIVWVLQDADIDEVQATPEVLRLLFEFWPDCPLKTIVADGAWDEDDWHELCERNYGIHLVASRTNPIRINAEHEIKAENHLVKMFNGVGQAWCRKHNEPLTCVGYEFPDRGKLGLAPGEATPASAFRVRLKCKATRDEEGRKVPDSCGTTSLQMCTHWTALAYFPHTPYSRPKWYAERHALLDHRNVCESAFNALKAGSGLGTVGSDRLRLNDYDSVRAIIDLSFCMGTALLLGQERDKLGVEYASPPWTGEQAVATAA